MPTRPNTSRPTHCLAVLLLVVLTVPLPQLQAQLSTRDRLVLKHYETRLDSFFYNSATKDSARYYIEQMIQFTQQASLPNEEIEAHFIKAGWAIMYRMLDTYQTAMEDASTVLEHNKAKLTDRIRTINFERRLIVFLYEHSLDKQQLAIQLGQQLVDDMDQVNDLSKVERTTLNQALLTLGVLYKTRGAYSEALACYFKANDLSKGSSINHHYIADLYFAQGVHDKAKENFILALEKLPELERKTRSKKDKLYISAYQGLAKTFLNEQKIDEAISQLDISLKYHKKEDHFLISTYNLYGKLFSYKQEYAKAKAYVQKALAVSKKRVRMKINHQYADIHLNLGHIYEQEGELQKALQQYQLAISNLAPGFVGDSDFSTNPSLSNVDFKIELLKALATKSKALYALDQKDKSGLLLSQNTAHLGIQLIDSIRADYTSEQDKQILIDQSYSLYEHAIKMAYQSGDFAQAFMLSEESRAIVLAEALQSRRASLLAEVAPETLYEIRAIKDIISQTSKALAQAADEEKIMALRSSLFKAKDEYQSKVAFIHEDVKYQQALKQQQNFSLDEVQQFVADGNNLLEFFVGENHIYAFLLQSKDPSRVQATQVPLSPELASAIDSINHYIKTEQHESYVKAAHLLYQQLFQPLFPQKPSNHLIIVPDSHLGNIPFGALLTEAVSSGAAKHFTSHPYWFKTTQISLAFSIATLLHQEQNPLQNTTNAPILVYAPFSDRTVNSGGEMFKKLVFSRKEAQFLAQAFGAQVLRDSLATSQHFVDQAHQASVLHLSTHGEVNLENPDLSFIAFSNLGNAQAEQFKLMVSDVYTQNLPCDMVVLSACETGIGKAMRGEGIISIARAFAYAGTRSIVTSLWKINDKITADLMMAFYQELQKSRSKDEALQQSMLAYLENDQIDLRRKSPKYWAAFTVIGDTSPIQLREGEGGMPISYFLVGGCLGILALVFWSRKGRATRESV
ncbi:MAG: CHAT domain-containing protein [Bacteroidota bacterium]